MRAEGSMTVDDGVARNRSTRSRSRGPGRGAVSAAPVHWGPSVRWGRPVPTARACAGDVRATLPASRTPGGPVRSADSSTGRSDDRGAGARYEPGGVGREAVDGAATPRTGTASGAGARRPIRASVAPHRTCLGTPGVRTIARRRPRGRTRAERVLVGVAVAVCSATVVVLLGLVADLSADAHSAPPPVSISVSP